MKWNTLADLIPNEIKENSMDFCRKLHITEALHNYTSEDDSIVKSKNEYCPTKCRNKALEEFGDRISNFPFNTLQSEKKNKSNFNSNE